MIGHAKEEHFEIVELKVSFHFVVEEKLKRSAVQKRVPDLAGRNLQELNACHCSLILILTLWIDFPFHQLDVWLLHLSDI